MALLRRGLRRLAAAGLALACAGAGLAQDAPSRENQIKAVFLFHFPEFVDWPPATFAKAESPLVIGVLGSDPFGDFLDEMVRGEKVNNRPLTIVRCQSVEEASGCQELFISRSEDGRLASILAQLKGRSILTVSDADFFDQDGGVIRLATENNRIRLKVNLAAARAADLTISSKLLRRADITGGEGGDR
jgi:hypothetical protein